MTDLLVRPSVEGAVIRDPASGDDLPPEGRRVPSSPYWHALLARGDVIAADPEPAAIDPGPEAVSPPAKSKTAKGD